MFPWDLVANPGTFPYQGIGVGALGDIIGGIPIPEPGVTAPGIAAVMDVKTAMGLCARVKTFNLLGSLSFKPASGGTITGTIDIDCNAVNFVDGGTLASEEDIARHAGWYGQNESELLWNFHPDEGPDEGVVVGAGEVRWRFSRVTSEPQGHDPTIIYVGAELQISDYGITVGRTYPEDGCVITTTLPVTSGTSFDNYGDTTFYFEWGSPVAESGPHAVTTGSFTFNPKVYWPYDTEDGDGPIFDATTGEWIRDPIGI